MDSTKNESFLRDYQYDAVKRMCNGCILNGGVGSGKSRTALYYYFTEQGGIIEPGEYEPMEWPRDLYIITTALKRDSFEWEAELGHFLLSTKPEENTLNHNVKITIDSWNNIKKYIDEIDCFFIFDEDRVTGNGAWVKAFLKITKHNDWIILSATPGDRWLDYIPVFVANGFYKNKTQFIREHVRYDPHCKQFPKVAGYYDTRRLERYRDRILVDMDFERTTRRHDEVIFCEYDRAKYKEAIRTRWDPFKNEPIQQASGLCYVLRRIVNSDESRQVALLELLEDHPKAIIFYNFDYELEILEDICDGYIIAEWNGHHHDELPDGDSWVYLVQYNAGAEGWNCITTDTIIFYSQNYSYRTLEQAKGRIDRLNTPYTDLYYYCLRTRSGIDGAIAKAISEKKQFNERKFVKW